MRRVLVVGIALVACVGMAFADARLSVNSQDIVDAKNAAITHSSQTPGLPVGGEDIGTATVIGGLPYLDAGDTGLYLDNYDEACPYTGSTSPDVVYAYTATSNTGLEISLCSDGNEYDTKVYVYENTAGNLVACNDDACANIWTSFASYLECVEVTAGNTYYIVVDGYGGASGAYELSVAECTPPTPCNQDCPPNAILEHEVDCYDNYVDVTNGGCNSTPPVFTDVACSGDPTVVCGTTGEFLFNGLNYRDTDWYRISWGGGVMNVNMCIGTGIPVVGIIDAVCPVTATICFEGGDTVYGATCEADLPAGDYYIFASVDFYSGVPCGTPYVLTISGCPSTGTENTSWGGVKGLFR